MQTPAISLSLAAFPAQSQSTAGALQRFVQNIAIAGAAALSGFFIDRFGTSSVWIFTATLAFVTVAVVAGLTSATTHALKRSLQAKVTVGLAATP